MKFSFNTTCEYALTTFLPVMQSTDKKKCPVPNQKCQQSQERVKRKRYSQQMKTIKAGIKNERFKFLKGYEELIHYRLFLKLNHLEKQN